MSKVEGEGGPIAPPPSSVRATIFSSRLLGLIKVDRNRKVKSSYETAPIIYWLKPKLWQNTI